MNRSKLSKLADTLIEDYQAKKINATDINSVRKVAEFKLKNELGQLKYNLSQNSKEKQEYFENGN